MEPIFGVNDKKSCARDGHDIQKNQSTDLSLECDGYKKKGMRDYVRTCVDVLVYGRRGLGCDDHAEAVCSGERADTTNEVHHFW